MRPQSSQPLTLEEHRELGREVRVARARLREMCGLVVDVYGGPSLVGHSFRHAMEALEKLCGDLEAQAAADHPGYKVDGYYR